MAIARYPRPGDRLAPLALREILQERAPPRLVGKSLGRKKLLCDLDETVWESLSNEQISQIGEIIVARVRNKDCNQVVHQRHLPRLPQGATLEDLCLENRTYNCLRREGFGENPQRLAGRTLGEMLKIRAFGARCLVDLLTALETYIAREGVLDEQLTTEARRLADVPGALAIRHDDPRLGSLMRAIDGDVRTVKELVEGIFERRLDPPDAFRICEDIVALRKRAEEVCGQCLEDELVELFTPKTKPRNRKIVSEYYGWDGGAGGTLKELGGRHGLTRERIRQVCAKAVQGKAGLKFYSPVFERARTLAAKHAPTTPERLRTELIEAGLLRRGMRLECFVDAMSFLLKKPPLRIVKVGSAWLAVAPHQEKMPKAIVEAAKKAVFNYGLSSVSLIKAELSALFPSGLDSAIVTATLATLDDFCWLDQSSGWFHLKQQAAHGLPKMLDKFLAVVGEATVSDLSAVVQRHRRMRQLSVPNSVLLEYCRQAPGITVNSSHIAADPPRDWRGALTGIEAAMVELLKTHGPVLERGEFEELCVAADVNRSSFNVYLMHSPIIRQYGRSVYGLPGLRVPSKQVEAIASGGSSRGGGPKVLEGFGWLDEHNVWLGYRLSRGTIGSGVVTVPAALKNKIQGRFDLTAYDGHHVGTLVMKKDSGWGMSPYIRYRNSRQGDYMLITIDLAGGTAKIDVGDHSIMDRVAQAV
ncbi:MAG: hypothetical protein IIA67_04120 [Planctomycetes bacterium]|nr:hypothetical protein [Planctomycetota bacterium]